MERMAPEDLEVGITALQWLIGCNIKKTYLDYLKYLRPNRQRNGLFDLFGLFRNNMTTECLLGVYWASIGCLLTSIDVY